MAFGPTRTLLAKNIENNPMQSSPIPPGGMLDRSARHFDTFGRPVGHARQRRGRFANPDEKHAGLFCLAAIGRSSPGSRAG